MNYSYNAYHKGTNHNIQQLIKEGVGINSISRLLSISKTTVLKKILIIASAVVKPPIPKDITIEIDELKTYTKSKINERWVVAAYCRETKKVIDYKVGRRTTKTLQCIIDTLLFANPKKIYSDRLNIYPKLIPKHLHSTNRTFNFDCIIYPSVGNDFGTDNLAVHPDSVEKEFELSQITEFEIEESYYEKKYVRNHPEVITLAKVKNRVNAKNILDNGDIVW